MKKSILTIAMEGYSFGAERGQVRTISDNDHLIPIYSYDMGAFEFDHKKVNPMAKLSQDKAEEHIKNHYSPITK